jgi:hypothetical protein
MKKLLALTLLLGSGIHASATTAAAAITGTSAAFANFMQMTIMGDPSPQNLVDGLNANPQLSKEDEAVLLGLYFSAVHSTSSKVRDYAPESDQYKEAKEKLPKELIDYYSVLQAVSEEAFQAHQKTCAWAATKKPGLLKVWAHADKLRTEAADRLKQQQRLILSTLMQHKSEHSGAFTNIASIINGYTKPYFTVPTPEEMDALTAPEATLAQTTSRGCTVS